MKRLTFVVGVACVLSLFAPIVAQTTPPANFVAVATIKVKPAAVADFEDYLKKLNVAGLKIGLKVRADTYQTVQGGSPFQYDVVQGFQTLEELGAVPAVPAILTKALGDAEAAKLMRGGRAAIESVEYSTLQYQADISTKPRLPVASPFFQLVRIEIDPQMGPQYTEYLRRVKSAGDKFSAAPTALRHTNLFGPAFVYLFAQPFATWAERAKWANPGEPLTAAYGDVETAQLNEINRNATRARTVWVVQHRPDLSRIPGTS
ncbi:MAG: hypothetical protein K2Y23_23715 [Cyanobacteria bacterium]|nr:hypothetical protein [Cyanobacteriota bacterium]